MDSPSPPAPPDPAAVSAAQAAQNQATAVTQTGLNSTNQETPAGNLTYSQIGTWPDGTPRFQATTSLSPGEQSIYDINTETRGNVGRIGRDQSARVGDILGTPFDPDPAANNEIARIYKGFLDPEWDARSQSTETELLNRGIRPGSEAYDRAREGFSDERSRAYNQMYLDAYKTAVGTATAKRNQPLNEISALVSGSQVSQPNFINTPNTPVAGTDVIGPAYSSYQGEQQNYNTQVNSRNAMMGAVLGIPATVAGGWARAGFPSDARLKTDIRRVGATDDGTPVYTFRYKSGGPAQMGVMAQDLLKTRPNAVSVGADGFMLVDYSQVV
jgi:hypothetical protein